MRVDTGVFEGGEISMFYDPMIAKLCSYGKTRLDAIERMRRALDEFMSAACRTTCRSWRR